MLHPVCSECPRPVFGAAQTCSGTCRVRRHRRLQGEAAARTREALAALVSAVESGDSYAASRAKQDARGVLAAHRFPR